MTPLDISGEGPARVTRDPDGGFRVELWRSAGPDGVCLGTDEYYSFGRVDPYRADLMVTTVPRARWRVVRDAEGRTEVEIVPTSGD